jgi:HD-like signal output (HDOD) protein
MFQNIWQRLTQRPSHPEESPASDAPVAAEAPVAPPAPATPNAPPAGEASEASLRRSLEWRCRVLVDGATLEALRSDGPALVESIRTSQDTIIRQPPLAAQQALRVARDPHSSYAQVVELIETDPALAPELLRHSNSAYYRREGPALVSLHDAAQRVGLQGIESVLTSAMVHGLLCRPGSAYDAHVQKVWSHMQRTAPLARGLAPAFGVDQEQAWLLALLHDVGKLVVFDHLSTLRRERRRDLQVPDLFFRQMLWHVHEPLGGLAVLRWGLGGAAARAVSEHHRRLTPQPADPMTELLYVAEAIELAHANGSKLDWDEIWQSGGIRADRAEVEQRLVRMEPEAA